MSIFFGFAYLLMFSYNLHLLMSDISNIKKPLSLHRSPMALYAATFFFSGGHGGLFMLALPFVVTLLGGSDKELGLCFGLGTMTYLISCLTIANHIDRFNPKRVLQCSSAVIALTLAGLFVCIRIFLAGRLPINPILLVIIVEILSCVALALFWPPMMGWLSTGLEGQSLSKRMGLFNISWSLALVVTTFIGGYILNKDTNLAVIVSALFITCAFVFISIAPKWQGSDTGSNIDDQEQMPETVDPLNAVFCSMSRFGLVIGCLALGLFRTQFALFFTENLGFSKQQFGVVTAIFCFASFAGFTIIGRFKKWHYKLSPLIGSQLIIAASMLMILFCTSLIWLYAAAVFIGIGQSFVYASHQYYCVSGKIKRSGSMAIHEILISIGYAGGSIAGGYLAEYLSRYWPYWFGFSAVVIALVVQGLIFVSYKNRKLKVHG